MRTLLPILVFLMTGISLNGQEKLEDTAKTSVDLTSFRQSGKVVRAEYGKVIMFFNQSDYLKTEVAADTVRVTPKYFNDSVIARLLREGRVKVVRRLNNTVQDTIVHSLRQSGSMVFREFNLQNGVSFFSHLEFTGIYGAIEWRLPKQGEVVKKEPPVQVEKFAYPEEFLNTQDTTKVKTRDYFPIKDLSHYVYNDNNGYGELDTNICKTTRLKGRKVFYFAKCYNKFGGVSIGATMFDEGIYFYKNGSLFTIEAGDEKQIKEKRIRDAIQLLPANMTTGDSWTVHLDMHKEVYTFLTKEDLQIGDTLLRDCIKLKIKTYWPSTIYISYVWLQKDTGLVKWMRSTGRIDELAGHY